MKRIAIISPSDYDFRMFVHQQKQTDKETEFIHISNLNQCYGIEINDYISITNIAKMKNLNNIISQLQKQIK